MARNRQPPPDGSRRSDIGGYCRRDNNPQQDGQRPRGSHHCRYQPYAASAVVDARPRDLAIEAGRPVDDFHLNVVTHSEHETADVGSQLAARLTAGSVVLLYGDLGAGKTAFVKGLAEG